MQRYELDRPPTGGPRAGSGRGETVAGRRLVRTAPDVGLEADLTKAALPAHDGQPAEDT